MRVTTTCLHDFGSWYGMFTLSGYTTRMQKPIRNDATQNAEIVCAHYLSNGTRATRALLFLESDRHIDFSYYWQ